MHRNQSIYRLLSMAAVLFFIGTQSGWLAWAEKETCLQDMILSISSDFEGDDHVPHFELGLLPDEYKPLHLGPALTPGISLTGRAHSVSPYKGLKGRSPPTLLSNYL